ncbi:MAG: adenylyl-sulfate kinase [Alphaproteobacteria bacterium]|nr:adenylyl-sulfate kinase [Alphaproteobacteria bacterium]MBT4016581.1 adenylyl-sulfate kinase [Alphaproteobacteria bacterium]MBT5159147.1 adenylyl-sulfate kinase [Alphaproteobacteria bacterium]
MTTSIGAETKPLRIAVPVAPDKATTALSGILLSGIVQDGDRLIFSPDNELVTVLACVQSGDNKVSLTLAQPIRLTGPALASHEDNVPVQTDVFLLKLDPAINKDQLSASNLEVRLATGTFAITAFAVAEDQLTHDEIVVRCTDVVAVDKYQDHETTGSCALLASGVVISQGRINMAGYADQRQLRTVRATNITRVDHRVTDADRVVKFGHTGGVLWLTGLSGSGKSTLAVELEKELFNRDYQVYVLDGDNIRHGLNANLGFSPEDRSENIRRVGEVAALFARAGFIAISAFISPYQSDRERARKATDDFHEIFVSANLDICEQRDPKGLYVKARKGEIPDFTGISAPYEKPDHPALTVDTGVLTVEQSVQVILDYVIRNFETTEKDAAPKS